MPWSIKDVDRHKKGLSKKQKEKWVKVANSVLASCLKEGGKQKDCEAKAIRIANGVTGNQDFSITNNIQVNDYQLRREVFEGKAHIVVPVVMMVEGVHNGSAGPLYHTSEELAKFPNAWNGIPVVVNHPEIEGMPVSANEPEILQSNQVVGRVFNTRFENGKLKGEAWIDEEKIKIVSPETYEILLQGRPLEVSVGVFSDEEPVQGEWNGEIYKAIARNYRPDHLALLPYAKGACSWEDGCGVRVNQQKEEIDVSVNELVKEGLLFHRLKPGFLEIADKIQRLLESKNDDLVGYYLQEVFQNYVVYEVYNRETKSSKLVKRPYKLMDDGTVEFTGDPQEVSKKVEYIPVQSNQSKKFVRTNKKGGKDMICEDKIKILTKAGLFSQEEGELIEQLGEEKVDKLIQLIANQKTEGNKDKEDKMTKEEALKVLKESRVEFEEVKDFLPEDVQSKVEEGLKIHADYRKKLIEKITTNSEDWKEEELQGFQTSILEKLAKTVTKKEKQTDDVTDYTLAGGGAPANNQEQPEILMPPMMTVNSEKGKQAN